MRWIYCYPEIFDFSGSRADRFTAMRVVFQTYRWKCFVDSEQAVDASKVTLSFHYIWVKETRWMRHQVNNLFQKWTGKIFTRRKIILQLVRDVRMKNVSLENVEVNPSSVNLDLPQKRRKCYGTTRCMCIIGKKPTYGTCSAGILKITYVKCKGCSIAHVWST